MKTQKENIIYNIFFCVFIIMYLKMHYYIKFIMFFFRVFVIMYLKNALLDMCYFLIFSHIYIYLVSRKMAQDCKRAPTDQRGD